MRLEPFSDGKKRNWGFWQQESSESSWSEYGKSWVSVLKNIRTVLESSVLEGCSLLLPSPEVFFHIDCRLKNAVTKIHKYYFSIKKIWQNTFFLIDGWKPGFSSKIPPTVKTSGLGSIGKKETSIRKCCYDISWGLVASGIHQFVWMDEHIPSWLTLWIPPNLQALPVLKEGYHGALWHSSLRMILEVVFSWDFQILDKVEAVPQ